MLKQSIYLLSGLAFSLAAFAADKPHWSHHGEHGPDHWGQLSPEFATCAKGRNQSPIDLAGFIEAELPSLDFQYDRADADEILNNGHTIRVNYPAGNQLTVDGIAFELKQFHFHAPSENHIQGKPYALEAHLVHADQAGNLAVIAVMFEQGEANPLIAKLWEVMPKKAGEQAGLSGVSPLELLPENRDYYRFNGSLTTPPCSEGVRWLVMKQPLTVSEAQIKTFSELMGGPNNRPVQPINARPVLK